MIAATGVCHCKHPLSRAPRIVDDVEFTNRAGHVDEGHGRELTLPLRSPLDYACPTNEKPVSNSAPKAYSSHWLQITYRRLADGDRPCLIE